VRDGWRGEGARGLPTDDRAGHPCAAFTDVERAPRVVRCVSANSPVACRA